MTIFQTRALLIAASLTTISLAGCDVKPDETAAAPDGEVTREMVPTATSGPEPAPSDATTLGTVREPLRVGSGPAGREPYLEQVNVAGDVLTVQIRYAMPEGQRLNYATERFPVEEVSVIDDGTAQELGVLQDNRGQFLAAPLDDKNKETMTLKLYGNPLVAWFKFPAPAPETRTVSINVPGTAPFDGVPIRRY